MRNCPVIKARKSLVFAHENSEHVSLANIRHFIWVKLSKWKHNRRVSKPLMDDVILSRYNVGNLGAEHNMYWIKKLLWQENKQTIKDE